MGSKKKQNKNYIIRHPRKCADRTDGRNRLLATLESGIIEWEVNILPIVGTV